MAVFPLYVCMRVRDFNVCLCLQLHMRCHRKVCADVRECLPVCIHHSVGVCARGVYITVVGMTSVDVNTRHFNCARCAWRKRASFLSGLNSAGPSSANNEVHSWR